MQNCSYICAHKRYSMYAFSGCSALTYKALQIKHTRNSNNKPFFTISLLRFNTISAFISKKKTQFSKLYLCNCPEKMGKIGFVLSVFRLFVFGQAKNLQGIPFCQLKYGEGATHTAPEDCTEWILFCIENSSLRRKHTERTLYRDYRSVIPVDNQQNTMIASHYHILARI